MKHWSASTLAARGQSLPSSKRAEPARLLRCSSVEYVECSPSSRLAAGPAAPISARSDFIHGLLGAVVVVGVVLLVPRLALARAAGIGAEGCTGCHNGGNEPTVTLVADPAQPQPGQSALITIRISRTNGNMGAFFLKAGQGTLSAVDGYNVRLFPPNGVGHGSPRTATSGDVIFQVRWTPPNTAGATELDVWGMSGDGGGNARNDKETHVRAGISYGCAGKSVYPDEDGDGWGLEGFYGPVFLCNPGPKYATRGGDCHDGNANLHPGAMEVCNGLDDNCNGMLDEGLPMVPLWRDRDGDGAGARNGEMKMGCNGTPGWAPRGDDCNDDDNKVSPSAMEMCNNRDDDCDGRIDNGARHACGEGWCRRAAPSCDPSTCVPGPPRAEVCNAFDDDCDGVVDNGPNLCPVGQGCVLGACVIGGVPPDAGRDGPVASRTDAGVGTGSVDAGPALEPPSPAASGCAAVGPQRAGAALARVGGLVLVLIGIARLRRRR